MRLGGVALAVAAVALAAAAPAGAEVIGKAGGFTYVKQKGLLPKGPGPQSAEVTITCPAGQVAVGGGASVAGRPKGTAIASSGAPGEGTEWLMQGWHTGINAKNETATSWGICSPKEDKISNEFFSTPVASAPSGQNLTRPCSVGHVTGGGALLPDPPTDWWLNSIGPVELGDADEIPDDGWVAWVNHPSGGASSMSTNAVCMEGKMPTYRSKVREDQDTVSLETVKVFCPKKKSATGGGAFASASTEDSHIVMTAPIDSKKDGDKVPDDGWKAKSFNDNGVDQDFTASVVCK